jgi:rRNA-processing protein FCF1
MIKIILDTNFLMAISQFKIDIFEEIRRISDFKYQICILDKTIDELNNIIRTQKGKNKLAANLALQINKKHHDN